MRPSSPLVPFPAYRVLWYGRSVKGSLGGDAEHWYYVRNTRNTRLCSRCFSHRSRQPRRKNMRQSVGDNCHVAINATRSRGQKSEIIDTRDNAENAARNNSAGSRGGGARSWASMTLRAANLPSAYSVGAFRWIIREFRGRPSEKLRR